MEAHIRILYRARILTQIYLTLSTHCGLMKLISSSFWTSCNTLYLDVVMWLNSTSVQSVQLISCIQLFVTPWTAACQASLSITNSWRLPKPMSIESVMPSNHLILCCPLLLLPSIFPSIRVFSNESVLRIRWPKFHILDVNGSDMYHCKTGP